jgi:hypothetical protein
MTVPAAQESYAAFPKCGSCAPTEWVRLSAASRTHRNELSCDERMCLRVASHSARAPGLAPQSALGDGTPCSASLAERGRPRLSAFAVQLASKFRASWVGDPGSAV